MPKLYQISLPPAQTVPIVASIPHAGEFIPAEIANQMHPEHIDFPYHTDWHVDKLFKFLPGLGLPVISADISRYVVDLNRAAKEPLFGTFQDSPIFLQTSDGLALYHTRPDADSVKSRIPTYYEPYHQQLKSLLEQTRNKFGTAYLLDLHSFRSHYLPQDVCLGNLNGTTCSLEFISGIQTKLEAAGLSVIANEKFIGGHITAHYAQMEKVETLQIEFRRAFYLNGFELKNQQKPTSDSTQFLVAQEKLQNIFDRVSRGILRGDFF